MNSLDIQPGMIFIAADGDDIGRKVGRAVIANDFDKLHEISSRIDSAQDLIARWTKEMGGIKISGGGDEFTAAIPKDKVEHIERLRKDIEYAFGYTISVGLGKSLSEAGKALLIAKLKGKNRIIKFGTATEKEIKAIKRRAKKGAIKSMEEYKLAEAYLNKSESEALCPYCQLTDGIDPDHCKFCHDAEMAEGSEACPYCAENSGGGVLDEQNCEFCQNAAVAEGAEACPYCKENSSQAVSLDGTAKEEDIANRTKQAESIEAMGMTPPAIDKQSPEIPPPVAPAPPLGIEGAIDPEDNHSKDALNSIAAQIEAEGSPTASQVNAIDETSMAAGNEMEGNISRPEGFAQNTPGDMGTHGENGPIDVDEDPDLSSLLEEGLDEHADGIQKEKVIQMTSQALQQFKACKGILEAARAQTPQLYQASITMLKAMIEMANLLGLGQGLGQNGASGQNSPELGQAQASLQPEVEQNEWHEVFPAHPDNGGAEQKPGHAPPKSAKEDGSPSPQP